MQGEERWRLIAEAATEVGPALFFSLLIITLSFVPVFALQAQEGRLFSPLAFTKTYAMAAAAGLSVTLVPVLMVLLIRGRIPLERRNPINRVLIAAYRPLLAGVLRAPWLALAVAALARRFHADPALAPGHRVPAAAVRGRPALHALGAARDLAEQGGASSCSRPTG